MTVAEFERSRPTFVKTVTGIKRVLTKLVEADPLFDRIRERCEQEFPFYARYYFKKTRGAKMEWHPGLHDRMAEQLQLVYIGELRNLILTAPPRYNKTKLLELFVAWTYRGNPRCEWMHMSFSEPLVLNNSDEVREIIKSPAHRSMWPHVRVRQHQDSKSAWVTEQGGKFLATHAAGPVTGFGAGRLDDVDDDGRYRFSGALWLDDPLKPDDAASDALREFVNERWHTTIKSRRNSPRTPTIITMQRLHQHDFAAARLEEREETWTRVNIPALIDEGQETERALYPAKHTVEQLRAMRDSSMVARAAFYAQMQGDPRALGGNLLQGRWFKRYDPRCPPQVRTRTIYGDTANKKGRQNDYTCLEEWGEMMDGGIVLLDLVREKWTSPELIKAVYRFWLRRKRMDSPGHRGKLRCIKIEDAASGTGLIQTLKEKGVFQEDDGTIVHRQPIPILPITRDKDKYSRWTDASPWLEGGHVWIPFEGSTPWVDAFVAECEAITADDTHEHDDQVDPFVDAVTDMLINRASVKISDEALKKARERTR